MLLGGRLESEEQRPVTDWLLPPWATEVRPHQVDAVNAVMREFRDGRKVVFMDAPTGAGKTLIAELVRQELGVAGLYVCTSHALQHQVEKDFTAARVLKGRGNYPMSYAPNMNADDCTYERQGEVEIECVGCVREECPYQLAKGEAVRADLAILNTAYWLRENQGRMSAFSNRGLVIIDEADTLETELMGLIEVTLSPARLKAWHLKAPPKGTHWPKVAAWLNGPVLSAIANARKAAKKKQDQKRLDDLARRIKFAASGDSENWVRSSEYGFALKPITVDRFGVQRVWSKGQRFLCMSATIINPHQMAEDLGLMVGEWGSVVVPSTFPVENRPIRIVPVADMKRKGATSWDDRAVQMASACIRVCRSHPGDRVLIHTVSHQLADRIAELLRAYYRDDRLILRTDAKGGPSARAVVVEEYRATPAAVLVAPGLERGVDLADEDCRVMIVAKVPYPNLGDPVVKARAYQGKAGDRWYQTETIRAIVQMTGRGVRNEDDWATSYVLDAGMRDFMRRSGRLFPAWWSEAIDKQYPKDRLLKGET